jgi:hypothetical protein
MFTRPQSVRFLSAVTLKALVYSVGIESEEKLQQRIFYVCQTIRNRLGTFSRVWQSTIRRVHLCIYSCGGHFVHLL